MKIIQFDKNHEQNGNWQVFKRNLTRSPENKWTLLLMDGSDNLDFISIKCTSLRSGTNGNTKESSLFLCCLK